MKKKVLLELIDDMPENIELDELFKRFLFHEKIEIAKAEARIKNSCEYATRRKNKSLIHEGN